MFGFAHPGRGQTSFGRMMQKYLTTGFNADSAHLCGRVIFEEALSNAALRPLLNALYSDGCKAPTRLANSKIVAVLFLPKLGIYTYICSGCGV
jgi:hypothetical protein